MLEQGRIDAVLSANPAQRRAIFEEAAGISRYRQRRHETELRLKRCEQDVERLDDLMGELRSRVRSLKIQATKAEKYVTAKAEWTTGRTRLLSHRLLAAEGSLEVLRPAIEELEGGVEGLRQRRSECEEGIEEREAERSTVVAELGTVSAEVGQSLCHCSDYARRTSCIRDCVFCSLSPLHGHQGCVATSWQDPPCSPTLPPA